MRYRRTYQSNVDGPDNFKEKRDNMDRLEDEIFEVSKVTFNFGGGNYEVKNADEIVESQNYFNIKRGNKYQLIKWSSVLIVELFLI